MNMNIRKFQKELFRKFLNNTLTKKEYETFMRFLQRADSENQVKKLIDEFETENNIFSEGNSLRTDEDSAKLFEKIKSQIETTSVDDSLPSKASKKFPIRRFYRIAAIFVLGVGLTYLIQNNFSFSESNVIADTIDNTDKITLELENGQVKIISEDGSTELVDSDGNLVGKQNGTKLIYDDKVQVEKLVYNTLTIPYGKKFEIKLSDGTTAYLNAGSSLKYPVKFLKGTPREVFLIGEAFFEVAKDLEHVFVVNTEDLDVQVFGTRFNVSSYPEDDSADVVLVEGSVGLTPNNEIIETKTTVLLEPGYRGSYSKKNSKNINVEKVSTNLYTSWMGDIMVFRNMSFENILKKLERQYNVEIVNNNEELAKEKFNASFNNAPIEKILGYFKTTYAIDFEINGSKIIVY